MRKLTKGRKKTVDTATIPMPTNNLSKRGMNKIASMTGLSDYQIKMAILEANNIWVSPKQIMAGHKARMRRLKKAEA